MPTVQRRGITFGSKTDARLPLPGRVAANQSGDQRIVLTSLIKRFGRRGSFLPPNPDGPLCVIGDVHGCIVQLEKLLSEVPQDHRIILVGDYVDRGEHSAEVLRLISARPDLTCLMGNHEEMLLRFLQDPKGQGPRWLRYGGLQTLASFGVRGARSEMNSDELTDCRDRLQEAMGVALCQWVSELPTWDMSGNVLVVHAGADPDSPPETQLDKTLVWVTRHFIPRSGAMVSGWCMDTRSSERLLRGRDAFPLIPAPLQQVC